MLMGGEVNSNLQVLLWSISRSLVLFKRLIELWTIKSWAMRCYMMIQRAEKWSFWGHWCRYGKLNIPEGTGIAFTMKIGDQMLDHNQWNLSREKRNFEIAHMYFRHLFLVSKLQELRFLQSAYESSR